MANEKIKLNTIFSKYKINFQETYSPSGWNFKTTCPFPDHNERTPSFHFNQRENRFNCFGCLRGGGPVNFISIYENKTQIEVARSLIGDKFQPEEISAQIESISDDEMYDILLDFTDKIFQFNESESFNKSAVDFSEKAAWAVDSYVRNHLRDHTININQLRSRINIVLEYLKNFKD